MRKWEARRSGWRKAGCKEGEVKKNNIEYGNLGNMTKLAIIALSQCPTASCPKRPFKYELWFFMFNSTSDCSSIEGKLFAPDEFLRLSFFISSPPSSLSDFQLYLMGQISLSAIYCRYVSWQTAKTRTWQKLPKMQQKKETKHSSAFGRWRFKVAVPKTTTCQLEHSQRQLNWTEREIIQVSSLQNLSQCCRFTHL